MYKKQGGMLMKIVELLSINLRYYRKKYNLSQEKFAEVLGTSLSHLNKIEQNKIDVKSSAIDKYAKRLNIYDSKLNISSEDLVTYKEERKTNFIRIDEKNKTT